jgi:hypothetical protein
MVSVEPILVWSQFPLGKCLYCRTGEEAKHSFCSSLFRIGFIVFVNVNGSVVRSQFFSGQMPLLQNKRRNNTDILLIAFLHWPRRRRRHWINSHPIRIVPWASSLCWDLFDEKRSSGLGFVAIFIRLHGIDKPLLEIANDLPIVLRFGIFSHRNPIKIRLRSACWGTSTVHSKYPLSSHNDLIVMSSENPAQEKVIDSFQNRFQGILGWFS